MSLRAGAKTIVNQCLNVHEDEFVVVINDGNDQALIDALLAAVEDATNTHAYVIYPEPEQHSAEPPAHIAHILKEADVGIIPTKKSLSHTQARVKACESGTRIATLPGITKEIWNTSLQADYAEVKRISEAVFDALKETETVHITTPSGTDLTFGVNIDYFHTDTGILHKKGAFGNLPAGEADGAPVNVNGTLVVDHFPFAPRGTTIEIKDSRVVAVKHPGNEVSALAQSFDQMACAKNVAEFGFGTNPKATLIGNILQDEKVLGTVHIAFGDNASYIPENDDRRVECDLHQDVVCEKPTVLFDDRVMLKKGDPVFLD